MNEKNITILTLWDNEKVEIEMDIEEFIQIQKEDKELWEKEFYVIKLKRSISYSDIRGKQGKTNYIALPEPKKEFKELTPNERRDRDKMLKGMLEKTYNARKKTFTETRKNILKELAKSEKRFNLQTTIQKLEELNQLRKENITLLKKDLQLK